MIRPLASSDTCCSCTQRSYKLIDPATEFIRVSSGTPPSPAAAPLGPSAASAIGSLGGSHGGVGDVSATPTAAAVADLLRLKKAAEEASSLQWRCGTRDAVVMRHA